MEATRFQPGQPVMYGGVRKSSETDTLSGTPGKISWPRRETRTGASGLPAWTQLRTYQ